jgi:uncharacterized protein YlxW (UPF0749 family)
MGLLDYVTAHSLDEDYADASARRRSGPAVPSRRRATVLVLLAFGVLLATAAAQTARTAPERSQSRQSLVAQVVDQRDDLQQARRDVAQTRAEVAEARAASLAASLDLADVRDEIARLEPVAGTVPVTGPGVRIVVDDNPDAVDEQGQVSDKDLQRLVNGLWVAGAEAVAVNARRITSLTAIRQAGEAITVNFTSLRRPYVVLAIGDPDTLPARFVDSPGGSYWLDVEAVFGLRFDMATEQSVTLPAVPVPALRYANQGPASEAGQRADQ